MCGDKSLFSSTHLRAARYSSRTHLRAAIYSMYIYKVVLAQLASMVCRAIYREGDEYDGRTRRYLIFDGTDRFALITFLMVA